MKTPFADAFRRSLPFATPLTLTTVLWCALLFWLHAEGRSPRAVPMWLRDGYYALQAVALPFVLQLQSAVGRRVLGPAPRAQEASEHAVAYPPLVFVVPDLVFLLVGKPEWMGLWIRGAAPVAALIALVLLIRAGGPARGLLAFLAQALIGASVLR